MIRSFPDLDYTVVADNTKYSHAVEYKVYKIFGYEESAPGVYEKPVWQDGDGNPVEDVTQAEVALSGSVKWDGCSNWQFDEQERGHMFHGCSKDHLLNLGKIMAECWSMTAELCPSWDKSIAE